MVLVLRRRRNGVRYVPFPYPQSHPTPRSIMTQKPKKLTNSGGKKKQEKQKVQEATAQDKIEMLVNRRAQLFKTKIEIEQKLADVRERMRLEKEKEEKEKSGAVAMPRR